MKAAVYRLSPNSKPQALYPADEIRAAKASRPGRGTRTDLATAAPKKEQRPVAPELETVIWLDSGDDISPLDVIPGVALTPQVGTRFTIEGADYEVSEPPLIGKRTDAGKPQVLVTLTVTEAEPLKGF